MKILKKSLFHCAPLLFVTLISSCGTPDKKDIIMTEKTTMQKLDSGLRFEVIKEAAADAKKPTKGQNVQVHYTGWLNNGADGLGAKFDSSVDRGQPFVFPVGVGYVIKGWDEGVAQMKVGQKIRLYVPAALGYGARGAGAAIPPNADLIFDVEFLAIS
jgi:FKBP-type peptidyl-prolyl cis-trans isomerase